MKKLESLLNGEENSFLINLRMNDEFNETQFKLIKLELISFLKKSKNQKDITKEFVVLTMDTILFLNGHVTGSKHQEKIYNAIDEISAIIRENLTEN